MPHDIEPQLLHEIFSKFEAFKEIRKIPDRGMAFIEYENEIIASKVLDKVRKSKILFELINDRVKINFATK